MLPWNGACSPSFQTADNFLSVYMGGELLIIELDEWVTQMWFQYGIVLYPSNNNRIVTNHDRSSEGPDTDTAA